jgi:hypothetical protein
VIRAGLDAYKQRGAAAAISTWLKNSPVGQASEATTSTLTHIEDGYGQMIGYDVLRVVPLGPHALRSYVVILYVKGPLYVRFDCYEARTQWIMTAFLFNTRPDSILPQATFAP